MNTTISVISLTTYEEEHDNDLQDMDPGFRVLMAVLIIQSIVTCVGNMLTIIVVYRDQYLRTTGNMCIVSLASADLIAGLTGVFDVIWFINKDVDAFLSKCKFCCLLWYILFFVSFAASLFSMSVIALDRWIFITYPLRYYIWMTFRKTAYMIGISWTAAILFGLMPTVINTFDTESGCSTNVTTNQGYLMFGIGIILFGSCLISFTFYFKIFLIAKKQNRSIHALNVLQGHSRKTYREIKILFLICCITFICWIPFYVENLPSMPPFSRITSNFILCLSLLNSCVNFFLYSAKNAAFRKSCLKLFPCIKCTFVRTNS